MNLKFLGLLFLFLQSSSFAADIAIIDTPVDFLNDNLYTRVVVNQKEWTPSEGGFNSNKFFDSQCPENGEETYYCRSNVAFELQYLLENDLDKNGYKGDLLGYDFISKDPITAEMPGYVVTRQEQLRVAKCSYLYSLYELSTISSSDLNTLRDCLNNDDIKDIFEKFEHHSHGTHVAGIVTSMSPNNKIYGTTFLKGFETGNADIELILKYISNRGTPIANCSYGGTGPYYAPSIENEKGLYESAGNVLFAVAAGNDSYDLNKNAYNVLPAMINAKNVITVAALKPNGDLAKFSNFGDNYIDVAAPGVAIKSFGLENRTVYMSGTSQATPHVAGIAGMIYDACPSKFTPEIAKKILIDTSDKKSWLIGKIKSGGIVNAQNAVAAMRKICGLKSSSISNGLLDTITAKYRTSIDLKTPPEDTKELLNTDLFNSDNVTFTKNL